MISPMTLEDFNQIAPVLKIEFDDFWNEHILKEELQNKNSHYYVAKRGDKIVGFAGIWKAVDDVHITNIVVRKSERQHGIGSALLEHLIEEGKKMTDIQSITLEVNEKNKAAIGLYTKYGFQNLGIRKNYYNIGENAIIMTYYYHK